MKPGLLKLTSLGGKKNWKRQLAYEVSRHIRSARYCYDKAAAAAEGSREEERALNDARNLWGIAGLKISMFGLSLREVEDALEDKPSRFDITPIGEWIMEAWDAAYRTAGRRQNGFCPFVEPSMTEIKTEYAMRSGFKPPADLATRRKWLRSLSTKKKIPTNQTFRTTLDRVELSVRKDKEDVGRPPGAKDTMKRKVRAGTRTAAKNRKPLGDF